MSNQYHRANPADLPPGMAMLSMITGFQLSQAICLAAKLGIADLLKDGPRTSHDLAQQTGTHARSLYRVLRALASRGIFAEDQEGRFGLTPLAETLQTDVPGSVRAMAMMTDMDWQPWGELAYSVQTGKPASAHVYGLSLFEYLEQHPEDAEIFNKAMTGVTSQFTVAVANTYDFSTIKTLVDVGGGYGQLVGMLLKRNPHMRGILFDLPAVIAGADKLLIAYEVADRCQLVSGDFFEAVPTGGDAYILKSVIHDWDDARAIQILKSIHRTMPDHSRLLLVEQVIPPGNVPSFGKMIDLEMMVMTNSGRERTEAELYMLLETAGFSVTALIATQVPVWIVEAQRI